ncbi:hypothetical protein TUBRATIS_006210 [Tubulinosema ratisbonensis]|uniref:Uncharacterized protein n=1 Tax=Tubulinosema ratisbonensis TaxID=291195 RepID=A0A437ANT7_9MICR|nr:hypothetical protein TUBRATIS_006210 [Tubulinosema ratisbonensis]
MFNFETNVIKEAKSSCLLEEKDCTVIGSLFLDQKRETEEFLEIKIKQISTDTPFTLLENILKDSFYSIFSGKIIKTKLKLNILIFSNQCLFSSVVNCASICLLQSGYFFNDWLIGLEYFDGNFIYKCISNELIYFNGKNFVHEDEFYKKIEESKGKIKEKLI